MKQLIIVLSGRKQSGKTTTCHHIAARYLNIIYPEPEFGVNLLGDFTQLQRVVNVNRYVEDGVKLYSFADPLKEFCVNVLGASPEQCYGTDAEKNSVIPHLSWDKVHPDMNPQRKQGSMTGRDLMQWFGTEVCRRLYHDVWAQGTYNQIKREHLRLALITDGRFPNEILLGKDNEGPNVIIKTLRLLRAVTEDNHPSETALDDFPLDQYSAVLDNRQMTLDEQLAALDPIIDEWFAEAGYINERSVSTEVPAEETV